MQEEFIIIFSWGVSQNPFCNSNKLLHFFILDRFKTQRDMTTCQIYFSCGIFPIGVTQREVRRLAYVQCVFYGYYTGGWLQYSDDKTSTEKELSNVTSLATFFYSCQFFTFFPLLKMFFSFSAYLSSRLWFFSFFPASFGLPQQWKLSGIDWIGSNTIEIQFQCLELKDRFPLTDVC